MSTLALSLVLTSRVCTAQEPIRVGVSLVNVTFSVRDQRALVDTSTRTTWKYSRMGVPQKISFFARSVDVHLTLGLIMDVSGSRSTSPSNINVISKSF
jgi:hypothetical protein